MTRETFEQILRERVKAMRETLVYKAKEYASDADRLHNFRTTAAEFGGTPAQAAWGFMLKHLTSIRDMVFGQQEVTQAKIDEKIGDAMNYLVLLEAILTEQIP